MHNPIQRVLDSPVRRILDSPIQRVPDNPVQQALHDTRAPARALADVAPVSPRRQPLPPIASLTMPAARAAGTDVMAMHANPHADRALAHAELPFAPAMRQSVMANGLDHAMPVVARPADAGIGHLPMATTPAVQRQALIQMQPDTVSDVGSSSPSPVPIAEPAMATADEPATEPDVEQLADRVYDILVRRLDIEREQRGW